MGWRQALFNRRNCATSSRVSSRTFAAFLRALKQQGYAVAIYYFSLANAQLAVRRVKLRVVLGGHDVPADVVRRRFGRSLHNFFHLYMPLADEWTLLDNSTATHARAIAANLANQLTVMESATWHKLNKRSKIV